MFIPVLMFLLLFIFILMSMSIGHLLNKQNLPGFQADIALVFGTGLGWKAETRWRHAAQLYRKGMVRYVIVSGGVNVPGFQQTEAEWFRDNLMDLGVPSKHILLETRATNAAENAAFALPIIQQLELKTVILVMSDFTGLRAHLTAKRAWTGTEIKIYNSHASSGSHWNQWTWWLSEEGWHLTLYVLNRLFRYRLLQYWWVPE